MATEELRQVSETEGGPTDSVPLDSAASEPSTASAKQKMANQEENSCPIIGIGASAGGLEAFELFFTNMPPDSGMAFVLVQHLDPTHESILVELIKRYTRMDVFQVTDSLKIEPNCIYIIPPNRDLALLHNQLKLTERSTRRGLRLPIDFFFRSLANEQKEKAICIILSGTGSDGTLGLKAIKEMGGMAMVQEPSSAKYDGMPRSAIRTGLVDYILPVSEMPEQLVGYVQHPFVQGMKKNDSSSYSTDSLRQIFILLRNQTTHDFSLYKRNTSIRRIQRRMTVNRIDRISDYVRYLKTNFLESEMLFKELLIGVTSFFRDKAAFAALEEKVIVTLIENRTAQQPLRVWVTACSTGEEAYSIAMLIREQMDARQIELKVQIFATDIDNQAIEKAREGLYPDSIVADVSPERLARFFIQEDSSYRIRKEIRDMVVFAVQSVIKDPPFSKIDLISCRNLLIYLDTNLKKRVVPLFHYALNPNGFLFLGTSETLSGYDIFFTSIDRKWKLFQRLESQPTVKTVLEFSPPFVSTELGVKSVNKALNLRQVLEKSLLKHYAPPAVIINERSEILYIFGRTGKYLEPAAGEITSNILRMARQGLRMALTTTIRKVIALKQMAIYKGVRVKTNGQSQIIDLTVHPILQPPAMQGLMIITFLDVAQEPLDVQYVPLDLNDEQEGRIAQLEQELKSAKEYQQTTIEELETANEEIKSMNEELQSSNEELQSTNEELETSKEELQSVNEELMTVNSELQDKISQLTLANNDLSNLLSSIQVGTIFLDLDLCIQRFNSSLQHIVNLINLDIGRPFSHFSTKLPKENLVGLAESVLDTLKIEEKEVQNQKGRWYWMEIRPYRTMDNVVEGVVMTFSDITRQKKVEQQLRHLTRAVEQSSTMIMILDLSGKIEYVNPEFSQLTGYDGEEAIGQAFGSLGTLTVNEPQKGEPLWQIVSREQQWRGELRYQHKNGQKLWLAASISPVRNPMGEISHFILVSDDVTERKKSEAEREEFLRQLEEQHNKLRTLIDTLSAQVWFCDVEENLVLANKAAARSVGIEKVEGLSLSMLHHLSKLSIYKADQRSRQLSEAPLIRSLQGETLRNEEEVVFDTRTGEKFYRQVNSTPLLKEDQVIGAVAIAHDVTELKRAKMESELLLALTQAIGEASDFESALEMTLNLVCEETVQTLGEIWRLDDKQKKVELSPSFYSCDLEDEKGNAKLAHFRKMSQNFTFLPGVGLPGRIWLSKEPEWQPDVSALPLEDYPRAKLAEEAGLKAALGVPIMADDELLAILIFYQAVSQTGIGIDKRLVELLSAVAGQLGSLLQRKRAEAALRQSEQLFRHIFEEGPLAMCIVDENFHFLQVNSALCELLGYSREELSQLSFVDITHPEDVEKDVELAKQVFRGELPSYKMKKRYLSKENKPIWVTLTAFVVRDDSGQVSYGLGMIKELSQGEEK